MNLQVVFLHFMALSAAQNNFPKVYEELSEQLLTDSLENIRKLREPNNNYAVVTNLYQPPVFNYQSAHQQDQRKFRYAQQQTVDFNNRLLRKPVSKLDSLSSIKRNQSFESRQVPVRVSLVQNWKAVDPKLLNNQKLLSSYNFLFKINETGIEDNEPTKSTRTSRKLKPDNYFQQNLLTEKRNINRQDHIPANGQVVYIDSNILHKHFGIDPNVAQNIIAKSVPNFPKSEQDLNALNDLIGKNPNAQLEGLKKLLQANLVQNKDHTPIVEQIIDIPNQQVRPNIHVNHNQGNNQLTQQVPVQVHNQALHAIQAHLDAAAQAEAQKVLAQARQEAFAHVEAQHQAIAKAQADAEKAALAQVAAQNQIYGHPQALPLKGNIIQIPLNFETNVIAQSDNSHQQNNEVIHNQEPVNPIALSLKSEIQTATPSYQNDKQIEESYNTPNHNHEAIALLQAEKAVLAQVQAQNNEILQAQKHAHHAQTSPVLLYSQQIEKQIQPNLEKVSVTKTHSVTQGQHSPNAYQKVVLETQHQKQMIYPSSAEKEQRNIQEQHDKQYASRYAFGYRIKDFEKGNDFGHEEKRDGKNAKGQYHVLLPDGRLQRVEYYADPTGYHAKVTYENVAHH